jgi:predicted phosphodiesterase
MPLYIPSQYQISDPILGSVLLERQLRKLNSAVHVYGHSHINRQAKIEGVSYITMLLLSE